MLVRMHAMACVDIAGEMTHLLTQSSHSVARSKVQCLPLDLLVEHGQLVQDWTARRQQGLQNTSR